MPDTRCSGGPRGCSRPAPEPWGGAEGCRSAALTAQGRRCHHLVALAGPAGTFPTSRAGLRPRGSHGIGRGAQAGGTGVAEQPFIEGRDGTGPSGRAPGPSARLALPWDRAPRWVPEITANLFPTTQRCCRGAPRHPPMAEGWCVRSEQLRGPAAPAPTPPVAGKGHLPGPTRSPGRAQANTAEFCQ